MAIQVIDHTFAPWVARKRQENGASTYSADICLAIIPKIKEHLGKNYTGKNILISTAPPLVDIDPNDIHMERPDLVIQFLHTYPYQSQFINIHDLLDRFSNSRIILVTAYEAYFYRLKRWIQIIGKSGSVTVHFQPMFILPQKAIKALSKPVCKFLHEEKRIIYFGNLYKGKATEYHRIKQGLAKAGWQLDVISRSQFNSSGKILNRDEIWQIISRYQYGIGVGRCALEMYALSLKILISGEHWGGLCMMPDDYKTQTRSNFNGRVITGTRDLNEALDLLPISHWQPPSYGEQADTEGLIQVIDNILI